MQLITHSPRLAASPRGDGRGRVQTFLESVLTLVDAHEEAARVASDALKAAAAAHDRAKCAHLTRKSDAHIKAAWALAILGIAVLISSDAALES